MYKRLKINILSTGTELVDPIIKPGPGQIREANSFLLEALLQTEACEVTRLHRVVDDLEGTIKVLDEALKADVLLISGGVSVGDSDFVKPALKGVRSRRNFLAGQNQTWQATFLWKAWRNQGFRLTRKSSFHIRSF